MLLFNYTLVIINDIGNISMSQYMWEPKHSCACPDKKCVVMKKSVTTGNNAWSPANCSENHHYMCVLQGTFESSILVGFLSFWPIAGLYICFMYVIFMFMFYV